MNERFYSCLLIFCVVSSQRIADFSDKNIERSSELHIRRKRVIDLTNRRDLPVYLTRARYIVNILKDNKTACSGGILSSRFVITASMCVYPLPVERYSILSGSEMRNEGTCHTIERLILVEPNPRSVLVEIFPHIDIEKSPNRPISLFSGAVPHMAYGTFSGWGCIHPELSDLCESEFPKQLMQTRLPLITLEECSIIYEERMRITEKNICTLDTTRRRGTCTGDQGGPLAVQFPPLKAPLLLGIMIHKGKELGVDPDVFINLNHNDINEWITDEIRNN